MPPHTTIRRITGNLKTKYNQNCQKTRPYGSLTTNDLKKKYSLGGQEGQKWGAEAERTHVAAVVRPAELGVPHSHKNQEGHLGSETCQPQARWQHSPGFQHQENKAS